MTDYRRPVRRYKYPKTALEVYHFWLSRIPARRGRDGKRQSPRKRQAITNILNAIDDVRSAFDVSEGDAIKLMKECVIRYRDSLEMLGIEADFTYKMENFFGERSYWENFVTEEKCFAWRERWEDRKWSVFEAKGKDW